MCEHDEKVQAALSRRGFLRNTGLIGAGAVALGAGGLATAGAASASTSSSAKWAPDTESLQFTLVVMPDTQYMYDGVAIHPEPVDASLAYILKEQKDQNMVFLAHLGDLTQNGADNEEAAVSKSFEVLDQAGAAYSVLAGNHDVTPAGGDDQRGHIPYLDYFGPSRFKSSPSYQGSSPDGYNSYHIFTAAGRQWLVLALDWRLSDKGVAWTKQVISQHPSLPVIMTTHEIVDCDFLGEEGYLSAYGQQMWDELINDNDQIFLTLNGHYWPPGRLVKQNAAGHDVQMHITNYQNRYYGGAAMIRLYHFDLNRNVIDVETVSPFLLNQSENHQNLLGTQEQLLTTDVDYFSLSIDFADRFSGFSPIPQRATRPAAELVTKDTLAYWRFDAGADGAVVAGSTKVQDLSGHGNDLIVANRPGSQSDALTWTSDHHPDQPTHGSLNLKGGAPTGDYLQTVANAPINAETFPNGYTVEAFFYVPADFSGANAWSAMLSRWGMSSEAGKVKQGNDGDPQEPVVTLSLSGDRELQWCVYPLTQDGNLTNWGHELPVGAWWHVAVVNNGQVTIMYVDGCEVVRNPTTVNKGLATINREWLVGGYEYGGELNQVYYGKIGDIRITKKSMKPEEFMNA